MANQRELNVGFVTEHEKLRQNTNSFWGPEGSPFTYTTSRWGLVSSREGSPDSDMESYQTVPTTGSSASAQAFLAAPPRSRLVEISPSPSPPPRLVKPPVLPYGGVISAEQRARRKARKGVLRPVASGSSSHKESTGSSHSKRRLRSPSPLEYAEDQPMKDREPSPDYSKWVPPLYFKRLEERLAKTDLGKPPSDEEQGRARFGIGWSSEDERAEASALQDLEESEIEGLVRTHTRRIPCR
jgi:hypothetical protein